MTLNENTRLDRIEEKIDKMSEAVVALARAEEKISALNETTHIILKRLVDYDIRMRQVESQSANAEIRLKSITKFAWITVTAIIASITSMIGWYSSK